MLNLRQYQEEAIIALRMVLRGGIKRPVLFSPTGSGKTEMAMALIHGAVSKGKRVVFLCNRINLVNQASKRFYRSGINHGIIQGANTRGEYKDVVIASIQTIAKRAMPDTDLLIIDECHGAAGSKSFRQIIFDNKDKPIIGLTATPWAKGMARFYPELGGPLFEDMVIATTIPQLIKDKFLVDVEIYAPESPDMTGVKLSKNAFGEMDWSDSDIGKAVDKPALIGGIVEHWLKLSKDLPTVCFASNINHSKHIVEQFRAAGVAAEHIDCYTKDTERIEILKRIESGETIVISNVGILTEGWDCLDEKTEVLTPSGWKGIGCIHVKDLVYSLDRESGKMTISPVLRYVERTVNQGEKMVQFKSQHSNIRTTEGHEFHVKYRDLNGLSNKYLTKTGKELSNRKSAFYLPLSAEMDDPFPGLDVSDDVIKFVAWFMTDGGFNGKPTEIAINQSQAKPEYVEEIRMILARLGFDFRERVRLPHGGGHYDNGKAYHEFAIPKGNGTRHRRGWGEYEHLLVKTVSWHLHRMDRRQFKLFWDEMLKGDGEKMGGKSGWLWCNLKEQCDEFTHMALVRGFSASYSTRLTPNGVTMYRISVRDSQFIGINPSDPRATKINLVEPLPGEKVWCITNKNSTIVTRREGKIAIIGNCPTMKTMILARPTKSLIRYIQMIGRVLRPHESKKVALVLDHSGTVQRLGFPTDDLPMELDDGKAKEGKGEKKEVEPPVCSVCKFVKPRSSPICPKCGHFHRPKEVEHLPGELKKLEKKEKITMDDKQRWWSEFLALAGEKGKSRSWALAQYKQKFGVWPKGLMEEEIMPTSEVRSWVKSRQIAWANSQKSMTVRSVA